MGRRRTAASQETLGDSPGRGREVAGPGVISWGGLEGTTRRIGSGKGIQRVGTEA